MTRKQYYIATEDGKIPVTGYPVVILGYEQFSFFAHHYFVDGRYMNSISEPYFSKNWDISEKTTGKSIMPPSYPGNMSNKTRVGALAIVVERFKAMGRDFILPKLQSAVKATQDEAARERTRTAIDKGVPI